jgi:hypothetical protein
LAKKSHPGIREISKLTALFGATLSATKTFVPQWRAREALLPNFPSQNIHPMFDQFLKLKALYIFGFELEIQDPRLDVGFGTGDEMHAIPGRVT